MAKIRSLFVLLCLLFIPVALGCTPWDVSGDSPPRSPDDAVLGAVSPQGNGSDPVAPAPAHSGALTGEAIPGFGTIASGRAGSIDVLVRLEAIQAADSKRPDLDLALIIDQSGSMAGEKLRSVKQAAIDVIGRLEPTDRVTLIAYETDVHVHATRVLTDDSGKQQLRSQILGLQDMGSTALGPALFRGIDILGAAERGDGVLAHVMLLSDGLANEGEARPDVIAARAAAAFRNGIATSTLGVGLDYNEDLMTKIADQGGGRYHFIENGEDIPRVLGDEFAGLVSTVARNVELNIEPAPGQRVERVFGYPTTSDEDGGSVQARIGSFGSGQKREVIVRLQHGPSTGSTLSLGRMVVNFTDVQTGERDRLVLLPAVQLTEDVAAVRASERTEVTVRVAELEAAERLRMATEAVDRGSYGEAKQMIEGTLGDLRKQAEETPSAELDAQIQEMEEAYREVDDAKSSSAARKLYKKKHKSRVYLKGKK